MSLEVDSKNSDDDEHIMMAFHDGRHRISDVIPNTPWRTVYALTTIFAHLHVDYELVSTHAQKFEAVSNVVCDQTTDLQENLN